MLNFASASAIGPDHMPNVQIPDRNQYISDPANLLPMSVKTEVNRRLASLREATTVEFAVAIPPSLDDETVEEWSTQLFTLWGLGKKDKNNGVLLVISPDSRECRIEVGYGMEGVLTDATCAEVIRRCIIPNMKKGDIGAAVNESTELLCEAIEKPEVAEELRSSQAENRMGMASQQESLSPEVLWNFFYIVVGCLFLASIIYFGFCVSKARKSHGLYAKAEFWRGRLLAFLLLGVFSCGTSLIFWLLALFLYRYYRMRPRKCPNCGGKMHRLSEEKDNEFLNDAQDFEEQIKTVDYDVWECDKCGSVERFPFKARQKKYTECPSCHTVAMSLQGNLIVRPATYKHPGEGVKIYECAYCGHQHKKPYKIPKKEDPSGALAAGAVLGAAASGRHHGGGFGGGGFGGGFGGGMSGGGGASGNW